MRGTSLLICLSITLFGCANVQEKKLVGKWQGASLIEDGVPMQVSPSEIGFEFFNKGFYHFRSTLNYREAGRYSLIGNLLYTMDTINEASTEKSVQILELSDDSLFLKMNAEGKEQLVKLFKVKAKR